MQRTPDELALFAVIAFAFIVSVIFLAEIFSRR